MATIQKATPRSGTAADDPSKDAKENSKEAAERTAFESLEQDFQEVLQELVGDKSLEHFRVEYEKLHRALKKSHESEKRLIKKCRELNQEIVSNAAKVQTALKLSQEDQGTIGNLKKEIERAWHMVEASHEKEVKAKQTIQVLKVEVNNLTRLVEQGAGISLNQENNVNNLIAQKEELVKQHDQLQAQVEEYNEGIANMVDIVEKMDGEKALGAMDLQNMRDLLNTKQMEAEREQRRKDRLAKEVSDLQNAFQEKANVLKQEEKTVDDLKEKRNGYEQQYKEQRRILEKIVAHEEVLQEDLATAMSKKKVEQDNIAELQVQNNELAGKNKAINEAIRSLILERTKLTKAKDGYIRSNRIMEDKQGDVARQRDEVKAEYESCCRSIEQLKKASDTSEKEKQTLFHERDILNYQMIISDDKTKKEIETAKVHEMSKHVMGQELEGWKAKFTKATKYLYTLDKQREKSGIELSAAKNKYFSSLEESKKRENKMSELKKNLNDIKNKLQLQKQQYEEVRTDRNLYSKNLIESQDEISEMKRKFKIMYHQIEQLKEEIKEKDDALQKENTEHEKVKKICLKTKDLLSKARKKQQTLNSQGESQNLEIKKIESSIQEAEQERLTQKKQYETIIQERDSLASQLIRKCDEVALLYEKVKIQLMSGQKGELCYQERCEEIRGAAITIQDTERQVRIQKQRAEDLGGLKREIYFARRELLGERTKVKALSEELENPTNIHRWRKLEGSDPTQIEMVQKVKTLQKRLIGKIEESVEKDLLLQEKEKTYLDLQAILARQPGQEVSEMVSVIHNSLKEKTKKMKATAAELNMYHAQVNDYKDDLERQTRELQEIKRKYFDQKRRNQLLSSTTERSMEVVPAN